MGAAGNVWRALGLTFLGAAGTGIGGLMVVAQPRMDFKRLGLLQGLAAGLMLCISMLDLLPEAAAEIGTVSANGFFYLGVLFFALVVHVIPEPEIMVLGNTESPPRIEVTAIAGPPAPAPPPAAAATGLPNSTRGAATATRPGVTIDTLTTRRSAQLPDGETALMAATPLKQRNPLPPSAPGAAGVTTTAVAAAVKENGFHHDGKPPPMHRSTNSSSSSGKQPVDRADLRQRRQVLMSGLITAVGIGLHNFPEGVAVFLAAQKNQALGVSLALAIALHNIPEGVAVALPVYFATRSRWQGFLTAFVSGLAEPLAVVVVGLLLPVDIPKHWVNCMLAAVGGIMAFLSFHELLPLSIQHAGRTAAVTSLFVGMAIMSFNLWVLDTYVTAGMPH